MSISSDAPPAQEVNDPASPTPLSASEQQKPLQTTTDFQVDQALQAPNQSQNPSDLLAPIDSTALLSDSVVTTESTPVDYLPSNTPPPANNQATEPVVVGINNDQPTANAAVGPDNEGQRRQQLASTRFTNIYPNRQYSIVPTSGSGLRCGLFALEKECCVDSCPSRI